MTVCCALPGLEDQVGGEVLVYIELDSGVLCLLEAGGIDSDGVVADGQERRGVLAGGVGLSGKDDGVLVGICNHYSGVWNSRPGRITSGAGDGARDILREKR